MCKTDYRGGGGGGGKNVLKIDYVICEQPLTVDYGGGGGGVNYCFGFRSPELYTILDLRVPLYYLMQSRKAIAGLPFAIRALTE